MKIIMVKIVILTQATSYLAIPRIQNSIVNDKENAKKKYNMMHNQLFLKLNMK